MNLQTVVAVLNYYKQCPLCGSSFDFDQLQKEYIRCNNDKDHFYYSQYNDWFKISYKFDATFYIISIFPEPIHKIYNGFVALRKLDIDPNNNIDVDVEANIHPDYWIKLKTKDQIDAAFSKVMLLR